MVRESGSDLSFVPQTNTGIVTNPFSVARRLLWKLFPPTVLDQSKLLLHISVIIKKTFNILCIHCLTYLSADTMNIDDQF